MSQASQLLQPCFFNSKSVYDRGYVGGCTFNLNLAQVHAALAYYYQHKVEMDALLRAEAQQAEQYLQQLE